MFYRKPSNMTYTDLAIYIDENVYKEDSDQETIFEYLYVLAHMLASKKCLFYNGRDYDEFALFFATDVFLRYQNSKQFDENSNMQPIKSVLNYMKSILIPRKISFQQKMYSQNFSKNKDGSHPEISIDNTFTQKLYDSLDELDKIDFSVCLGEFGKTTKYILKSTPYSSDPVMLKNIYISCLLSFLNSITFSKKERERLKNLVSPYCVINGAEILYKKNEPNSIILYKLDDEMHDYILVQLRRIKRILAMDLSLIYKTRITFDSYYTKLILAELNNEDVEYEEEE